MTKKFKNFIIIWIVEFVLFVGVTFLVPNKIFGITRFDKAVFWIAFALVVLSFALELVIAYKFINEENDMKTFLRIPLMKIVCISVTICLVVGLLFMLLPVIPTWIGAAVCLIVAGLTVIACAVPSAAVNYVNEIDQEVKVKTFFIKELTANAEALLACAKGDEIKEECIKVYEAIRYSDPMSVASLHVIDNKIADEFLLFSDAVKSGALESVKPLAENLLALIKERNVKCKLLK